MNHDLFTAQEARDEAITRVEENAAPDWKTFARIAVKLCAAQHETFTTDDVLRYMPSGVETHEPRAWGAIMRNMARQGLIESTPEYRVSSSAKCHARPKRVWRQA